VLSSVVPVPQQDQNYGRARHVTSNPLVRHPQQRHKSPPGNASISRRFTLLDITLETKMWSRVMDAEVHLLAGVRACVGAV